MGSRSKASADAFATQHGVARSHETYAALAADPDVDVVYVATPHSLHCENTLLCLDGGKAVLCEKPLAIHAREGARMVGRARERGLFLMEALWTRFFPLMGRLRQLLAEGVIGEVRSLSADFGFREELDPSSILFDPRYGGGSLLDVGVYPISLASLVFGPPTRVVAAAHLGETGVDEQAALILEHAGGPLALLQSAIRVETQQEAVLSGTRGRIRLRAPWWRPSELELTRPDLQTEVIRLPYEGNGYGHEAVEVMRCLRAGLTESPLLPLEESLSILRTLDAARAQWGLRYPADEA